MVLCLITSVSISVALVYFYFVVLLTTKYNYCCCVIVGIFFLEKPKRAKKLKHRGTVNISHGTHFIFVHYKCIKCFLKSCFKMSDGMMEYLIDLSPYQSFGSQSVKSGPKRTGHEAWSTAIRNGFTG